MKVMVNNLQRKYRLTKGLERLIKKRTLEILREKNKDGVVSVTLLDDRGMKALSRKFRPGRKLSATLSFPLKEKNLLGDVLISAETAARYAKIGGTSFQQEMVRLLTHGVRRLIP